MQDLPFPAPHPPCVLHQTIPQLLDTLRQMIGRSSKLAVQLAVGGLVPWLLAMIEAAAPILRVKLLEIVRCLYEHYPRPKEFIVMHKIPDVLRFVDSSSLGLMGWVLLPRTRGERSISI